MNGMKALRTAAPYVGKFRDKIFVVKLGGEVLDSAGATRSVGEQIALMWHLGIRVVLVHGGGTAVDGLAERLNVETPKVVKMALGGVAHLDFLSVLREVGLPVVGISGLDAGLIEASQRPPMTLETEDGLQTVDFGLVGDVERVDPALIYHLLAGGYVPVIAPLTATASGQLFNTNADTVAAHVAGAIDAEKLMFVMRVSGLLRDARQPNSLIPFLWESEADEMVASGAVSGGMRPKLAAVKNALAAGVKSVHLVGGYAPDSLLIEVFTNEGAGTMIRRDEPA
jgi:acetylglutamate kinase